jgi:integrase
MGSSCPGRVRVERGVYRQPNGKYAVCWRHAGRLRFRTVGFDVAEARRARLALIAATREGKVPVSPRLRFETVAGWWLERFEAKVAAGERRPRTLEAHRYQLDRHLLPALGRRRIAALTVDDVAELLHELRRTGRSAKTAASSLATLQSVLRFARRCGWIVADPVERLEHDERPRVERRRQRVLGRAEIERLLAACAPRDRLMVATVLYTGLRISELLGLIRDDVDFEAGVIHVRAQLSRAHRGDPARRVPPKTVASVRDVPLVAQLARLLNAHRQRSRFARGGDWVFTTTRGTPYGHRNVSRRCLGRAAQVAGLNDDGWPPLRIHDLRHTFASHLIVDLGLDPAQVSRILGHARITITPRHLHPPLRGRPPHARHPHPHDRQPIRPPTRAHDSRARRDGAHTPMTAAFVQRQARVKARTGRLVLVPDDSDRGVCRELRNHTRLSHKPSARPLDRF